MAGKVQTFFASARRVPASELERCAALAINNVLVDALFAASGGLALVLNAQRQIVALNDVALQQVGLDAASVMGLRPGEALGCVHAADNDGGCGTSVACRSCGLVLATLAAAVCDEPVEEDCMMAVHPAGGRRQDLVYRVRAQRLVLGDEHLQLLIMQDITRARRDAALGRAFLHDVGNSLTALIGAVTRAVDAPEVLRDGLEVEIAETVEQIRAEFGLQRMLLSGQRLIVAELHPVPVGAIVADAVRLARRHPVAHTRTLMLAPSPALPEARTDLHLAVRVLLNMLLNALEAEPEGATITISADATAEGVRLVVYNPSPMQPTVAQRVFQRHFSTKPGEGRGEGTYAMKLVGEQVLGGEVGFYSAPLEGTQFWLELPV